jgi:hypothetical protein
MTSFHLPAKYWVVLALILCTACSVLQPVHEALPPETLGPWGFRVGILAGESPTVATNLSGSTDMASYNMSMEGFRLGIGLGSSFELDDDLYLGGNASTGSSIALKWQILGHPLFETKGGDTALTFAIRNSTGSAPGLTSTDITQSSYYSSDLSLNSYDASLVLGQRFASFFGGYIGAKDISGTVTANFHAVQNGPVVATQSRNFSAYGGLAGLYLSALGNYAGFDLVFEYQYMNMPSTYSNNTIWATNYTVSMSIPFRFQKTANRDSVRSR